MRSSSVLRFAIVLSFVSACSPPTDTGDSAADARTTDAGTADSSSMVDVIDAGADAHTASDVALDSVMQADVVPASDVALDTSTDARGGAQDVSVSDVCNRPTIDTAAIGNTCGADATCPTSYTCQPVSGVVLTHSCQILCSSNCDCPGATVCVEMRDKSATWHQCVRPG